MVASVRTIDDIDLTQRPAARIGPVGGLLRCAAPAAFAVVLVLATTGFDFDLGERAHQPFISPLARLVASSGNAHTLFLAEHLIALTLYFLALLHILFRLGMREWPVLLMAGALLGLSRLDSGYSLLAGTDIVGRFNDTQAATALVIVSLALALNRRIVWALIVLGVAFNAGYVVALWGVAALLAVSIALAWESAAIRRDWAIGAPIALLFASPCIVWLAWSIASGHFDFHFLTEVQPNLWLVWTVSLQQWVLFVSMLTLGLSAFSVLGPRAKLLCAAFLGCFAVFVIGCVLPFVTDSQWLLTLCPMAADGLMQVLATVGAIAVVVQDMRYGGAGRVGLSLLVAASLLVSEYALPIGALAMLARAALAHGEMLGIERRVKPLNQRIVHNIAAPALMLIAVAGGVLRVTPLPQWIELPPQSDPGFVALVQWAKDATPADSVFLINGAAGDVFDTFQTLSRRTLWRSLHAPQERLQFACHAGVDYYADRTSDGFDPHAPALSSYLAFDQDGYFVIDTRRYCKH